MIKRIGQIFNKSPWDEFEKESEENIFTRKRQKNSNFNFNDFQFQFDLKYIPMIFIVIILLWLASGFYKVQEGQQAAIMRFGKFNRIAMAGLNYHIPTPIETVEIEKVDESKRIEIGYRSIKSYKNDNASSQDVKSESNMLTGDENIIELQADVMWHINDIKKYLFNVSSQEATVKSAAESAIREVIGNTPISSVLSNQKQSIAGKIENLTQTILDLYDAGVTIEQVKLLRAEPPQEVIAAYRDVQTAKADKEKYINESEAYRNNILPKARGEAAKIIHEAEGYKAELISIATGDASRFNSLYTQYKEGVDVTRSRLYIETIESILKDTNKVIMDSGNMLPHMAIKQK